MATRNQKIKQIIPALNGIFSNMEFDFGVEKNLMDLLFYSDYGERNPSPIVEAIQNEYGKPLTTQNLQNLAAALLAVNKNKWERLMQVALVDYDPIHNYLDEWEDSSVGDETKNDTLDSTRTDTFNSSDTTNRTRTDNLSESTNSTRTDNLSETETINESESSSDSQADNIYGFNSSNAVGKDTSSGTGTKTNTGTNTTANTGTQQVAETVLNTGTQGVVETVNHGGTNTRAFEQSDDQVNHDERERSGRHFGNIGNLTSQKQLVEEIELWRWKYIEEVLRDAKEFCTLPCYLREYR